MTLVIDEVMDVGNAKPRYIGIVSGTGNNMLSTGK